jgi:hypothetical protein
MNSDGPSGIDLLKPAEVATRLRVSRTWLYEHLHKALNLHGFAPPTDDAGLIDHEVIPLSLTLADGVITQLLAAATEVREKIDHARRN